MNSSDANNPQSRAANSVSPAPPKLMLIPSFLMGIYLGIIFAKSEVASWQRIHDMFLFRESHMYVVMGVAILVATPSMALIKRFRLRDIWGQPIVYRPKQFHRGVVIGGLIFGVGWAITGACPGPIYAQIGAGEWSALATLAGALFGMYLYAMLQAKWPH